MKTSDVHRVTLGAARVKGIASDYPKKMVENGKGTKVVHKFPLIASKEIDERDE
jgi:hypothetical protein